MLSWLHIQIDEIQFKASIKRCSRHEIGPYTPQLYSQASFLMISSKSYAYVRVFNAPIKSRTERRENAVQTSTTKIFYQRGSRSSPIANSRRDKFSNSTLSARPIRIFVKILVPFLRFAPGYPYYLDRRKFNTVSNFKYEISYVIHKIPLLTYSTSSVMSEIQKIMVSNSQRNIT